MIFVLDLDFLPLLFLFAFLQEFLLGQFAESAALLYVAALQKVLHHVHLLLDPLGRSSYKRAQHCTQLSSNVTNQHSTLTFRLLRPLREQGLADLVDLALFI